MKNPTKSLPLFFYPFFYFRGVCLFFSFYCYYYFLQVEFIQKKENYRKVCRYSLDINKLLFLCSTMSDLDLDPFCARALETLIESETTTRVALSRLEFHYLSEVAILIQTSLKEIEAVERMAASEEEEEEKEQEKGKKVEKNRFSDREGEERWMLEEEERIAGRMVVELHEAEDMERLKLSFKGLELGLVIDEAFKPCISLVYNYPWDIKDFRVLPLAPGVLDRVKNPERHLPKHMRKGCIASQPGVRALLLADHEASYQETLATLEAPPPLLQLTEG